MAALKEPVKIFIVQSLACFETPLQVVEAVKQDFNIEIMHKASLQVMLQDRSIMQLAWADSFQISYRKKAQFSPLITTVVTL